MALKEAEANLRDKVPWHLIHALRVTSHIPAEYIYLPDLSAALLRSNERSRVPLLLDTTAERSVDTFLAYQRTQAVDMPQLTASARTVEEIREVLRAKLVSCMKNGDMLLLKFKDSFPDMLGKFCSDDTFPTAVFSYGEVSTMESMARLFREEEKDHGVCVCRDGFRVVLTSWRPVVSFASDLRACVPLHKLAVFAVELEEGL
ncbi:hypothetical protein FOA52_011274 [Chlamydomonas sp. UWO 241]|nr:hypothetical protein FOA52_011274 [Chlamydomonas sp. UWO 241]